jgi:hypothetical protein
MWSKMGTVSRQTKSLLYVLLWQAFFGLYLQMEKKGEKEMSMFGDDRPNWNRIMEEAEEIMENEGVMPALACLSSVMQRIVDHPYHIETYGAYKKKEKEDD